MQTAQDLYGIVVKGNVVALRWNGNSEFGGRLKHLLIREKLD